MARGTKVSVGLEVTVSGADDIDAMARSVDAASKAAGKPIDVDAKVSGAADVDGLVTALADVTDTDARVDATVTGATDVAGLATDLDGLPASTSTGVTASVTGAADVEAVATDVAGMPASASSKVTATVTGAADLDTLAQDITDLPASKAVTVTASVTGAGGGSVKDLNDELDKVDGKTGEARGALSSLGGEMAGGELGSQFSEGAGTISEITEKLGGVWNEAGTTKEKLGGLATVVGGFGVTMVAGLALDSIIGIFTSISEKAAAVQADIETMSDAIVDAGGVMDQTVKALEFQKVKDDPGVQALIDQGMAREDVWDAAMGDAAAYARLDAEIQAQVTAPINSPTWIAQTQKALNDTSDLEEVAGGFGYIRDEAQTAAEAEFEYAKGRGYLSASAQAKVDAMNKEAAALKAVDGWVTDLNGNKLYPKEADMKYDDKATPALDKANKADLNDKQNDLKSVDYATPKLTTYNGRLMSDKESDLDANDYASARVSAFNNKALDDKTADIDANMGPARDAINDFDPPTIVADVTLNIPRRQLEAGGFILTPAMLPPAGVSPSAAPAMGRAAGTAPVSAPIQVTVNGALDPAAVARQIRQVLTRADRRVTALRSTDLRAPV